MTSGSKVVPVAFSMSCSVFEMFNLGYELGSGQERLVQTGFYGIVLFQWDILLAGPAYLQNLTA